MAWNLSGQLIESCTCNMFCPCWFLVPEVMVMDQGYCATVIALRIQRGTAEGVDLSGRTVVFAVDFPGPTLFDGNATFRLYLDDGAGPEQRRELEAIMTGQRGGPMEMIGGLVTTWLPTETAAIDVNEADETISVTVAGAGQMESRLMRDQQGQSFSLQGGGFVAGFGMQSADLAPSSTRWTDPDLRQFETKSGGRGHFTWSG